VNVRFDTFAFGDCKFSAAIVNVLQTETNFDIEQHKLTNNVMCIKLQLNKQTLINKNPHIICGISTINIITGKSYMFEYFIMMDMDDVCSGKMNKKHLKHFLKLGNDLPWDALTFNRPTYYDIWALSIKPYTFSCWHYAKHKQIYNNMLHYVNKQLAEVSVHDSRNALLPCISAFNGFGLYRTDKYIHSKYEWNVHATLAIYPKSEIDIMSRHVWSQPIARHDDCEHRYFHIRASQLNGARICISPVCLFS
jgi:hypothetical protein